MQTRVDPFMAIRCKLVRSIVVLLAALPLVLESCSDPGRESAEDAAAARAALLPGKVGPSGEVVMVVSESVWNLGVGAAVDSVFLRPVRVLPQYEPRFDVLRLDPEEFDPSGHGSGRFPNPYLMGIGSTPSRGCLNPEK